MSALFLCFTSLMSFHNIYLVSLNTVPFPNNTVDNYYRTRRTPLSQMVIVIYIDVSSDVSLDT